MTKSASCSSPLSFDVVSSFQIVPSQSGVFPKGFAFNSLISFPDGSLDRLFMLFFLYDFRKFFFELLIGFLKYVYDTYYEQETNYTGQIEEIIADHNDFVLKFCLAKIRFSPLVPKSNRQNRFQGLSFNESKIPVNSFPMSFDKRLFSTFFDISHDTENHGLRFLVAPSPRLALSTGSKNFRSPPLSLL
nr:MAG TPA: hypothetical protein [Caudoviricetes sp.]